MLVLTQQRNLPWLTNSELSRRKGRFAFSMTGRSGRTGYATREKLFPPTVKLNYLRYV